MELVATTHERLAELQKAIQDFQLTDRLTYGKMTLYGFCLLKLEIMDEETECKFLIWLISNLWGMSLLTDDSGWITIKY